MFEGKPPQSGEPRPLGTEPGEGGSLRPLKWDDLVARLSAAREFRDSLNGSARACESSFDAGSARLIAAHHNGKHLVNPDDSGNGKDDEGTASRLHKAGLGIPPGAARE